MVMMLSTGPGVQPLRSLTVTLDRTAFKEFLQQLRDFTSEQGMTSSAGQSAWDAQDIRASLKRGEVSIDITGWNIDGRKSGPSLRSEKLKYTVAVYPPDSGAPPPFAEVDPLMDMLKQRLLTVPTLTVIRDRKNTSPTD